jgi:two-component system, NarL family, invasion response regulator UvrY
VFVAKIIMIRILLVDDHELVRTGLEALLNAADDIAVVGVAQSGEEAVDKVINLSIDVVLMDINMPGIGGVEACRRILRHDPGVKIIAISVHNDGPHTTATVKARRHGLYFQGLFAWRDDSCHQKSHEGQALSL